MTHAATDKELGMDLLEDVKQRLQKFADDCDWDQFHSPRLLS